MTRTLILALAFFAASLIGQTTAQQPAKEPASKKEVASLQTKIESLEQKLSAAQSSITKQQRQLDNWIHYLGYAIPFLFGFIAAIWAQNTKRSPILWFIFAFFTGAIAMLVLLFKNRRSVQHRESREPKASKPREPGGNNPLTKKKIENPISLKQQKPDSD